MAHVIIFVDRAPRRENLDPETLHYSYPAGAYKIASVVREKNLDVLVVPNCLHLTYRGILEILKNNSKNLLWVGISTTFLTMRNSPESIARYREQWTQSTEHIIDFDNVLSRVNQGHGPTLLWGTKELSRLSFFLQRTYKVPLIIGGPFTDDLSREKQLHSNIHLVDGYAESYADQLTDQLLNQAEIPFLANNSHYDNHNFKQSSIRWESHDLIGPDDWLPIEIARGCAFDCAYCTFPKRRSFDSYKDPKSIREELIRNYEMFGTTKYMLVDDLYNDSKDKVRILYDQVWSKLPFTPEWGSYMRLDMFWTDPESIEIIKASGARCGSFGIETLHDVAGKRVGKGLGRARILETLKMLNANWGNDVIVTALMIAGLPFEPLESIKETMDWTATTNLVHGCAWAPFYASPPSRVGLLKYTHRIDNNPDKFGMQWLSDSSWINSEGVTTQQAQNLVENFKPNSSLNNKLTFSVYADLRTAGFSHQQIATLGNGSVTMEQFDESAKVIKQKIFNRLNKILTLTI